MSFIDDLTKRLTDAGIPASSIFRSSSALIPAAGPSTPGPYYTLTETGGTKPTWVQNRDTPATRKPSAQVMTRATTWDLARASAEIAFNALNGVFNTAVNGTNYLSITAVQEPTDLQQAEGYAMVAFNLDAEKEPT